ncbi:MAG: helicase-associated domain-containing protein [Chloroflexi bacterium]|uniref:Helicase-associated domain-containing protein n=1 Tax=Candidatus Chlorohelix allophototropha TaxID=3003348 RepID=A0A8T7M8G7_9CHLR|nr:helicase-associated domain-containing protein [Chloroflexota bacterium]WJW68364.1 helicase-associated domain-containing protein [Chloroflexota bacterium L227-S17]
MKTLVGYLNERSPIELRGIVDFWEVTLTTKLFSGNTFELAKQMTSEFMQRRMLEKLGLEQQRLLLTLVSQQEPVLQGIELAAMLQLPPAVADKLINELRNDGLIYPDTIRIPASGIESIMPPAPQRKNSWGDFNRRNQPELFQTKIVFTVPRELSRSLKRLISERLEVGEYKASNNQIKLSHLPLVSLLQKSEVEGLDILAELWGAYSLQGEAKNQQFYEELSRLMSEEATQKQILEDMDKDTRELFATLKQSHTTIDKLLKKYVSLKRLSRTIKPLLDYRLVWEAFEDGKSVVWVPNEIAQPRVATEQSGTLELQTVTEPTEMTKYPPYAFAWDLLTFLNYIRLNEVEVTNEGRIPKRHLKKIVELLWHPENPDALNRTALLINLCNSLDLVDREADEKAVRVAPILNEWLTVDLYEQTRRIFKFWLENNYFSEPLFFPYHYGSRENKVTAVNAMLGWLRDCQPGVWYSLKSLLLKVEKEQPFFIRPRRDLLNIFGAPRLQLMTRQWQKIEGEIIRSAFNMLFEWLGIVRISRDAQDIPVAFSLTDFGAEIAGHPQAVKQVFPETPKPLLALANFEIMLFVPHSQTLWELMQFTERKKLDSVSLYSMTRASILKAVESGKSAEAIQEWLKEKSSQPPAQNILISIQDWCKGFKAVEVQRTVLLETGSAEVLDELLASKQFAGFITRRLSPTAAILNIPPLESYSRSDPLKTFKTKLKNAGYSTR